MLRRRHRREGVGVQVGSRAIVTLTLQAKTTDLSVTISVSKKFINIKKSRSKVLSCLMTVGASRKGLKFYFWSESGADPVTSSCRRRPPLSGCSGACRGLLHHTTDTV